MCWSSLLGAAGHVLVQPARSRRACHSYWHTPRPVAVAAVLLQARLSVVQRLPGWLPAWSRMCRVRDTARAWLCSTCGLPAAAAGPWASFQHKRMSTCVAMLHA